MKSNKVYIKMVVNDIEIKNINNFEYKDNKLIIYHNPYEESYGNMKTTYDLSKYTVAIYFSNILEKENKYEKIIKPKYDDIKDMFNK